MVPEFSVSSVELCVNGHRLTIVFDLRLERDSCNESGMGYTARRISQIIQTVRFLIYKIGGNIVETNVDRPLRKFGVIHDSNRCDQHFAKGVSVAIDTSVENINFFLQRANIVLSEYLDSDK